MKSPINQQQEPTAEERVLTILMMMMMVVMMILMVIMIMRMMRMILIIILTQRVFLGDPQLMGEWENNGNVAIKDPENIFSSF